MFLLASDTAAAGGIGIGFTLVYIVVIVVIMYFLAIRPQKKEQKKLNAMLAELAVKRLNYEKAEQMVRTIYAQIPMEKEAMCMMITRPCLQENFGKT